MRSRAPLKLPPTLLQLCEALEQAGHGAWAVGGGVRDALRGVNPSDWDVATSATPTEVQRLFRKTIPTGIAHGTVSVLLRGQVYEVTTLRGEAGYQDGRRPVEVTFVQGIEDDLLRRDFTVNAIAFRPADGSWTDPYGGMADIEARCLRAVGDATMRFSEDGLRVLRAARFVATLGFSIEEETLRAIPATLDVFAKVSAERVHDELCKMFRASQPSLGWVVMRETGMLERVCPQLAGMTADAFVACLARVDSVRTAWGSERSSVAVCLAALFACHRDALPGGTLGDSDARTFASWRREVATWLQAYRFSKEETALWSAFSRETVQAWLWNPTAPGMRRMLAAVPQEHRRSWIRFLRALPPGDPLRAMNPDLADEEELGLAPNAGLVVDPAQQPVVDLTQQETYFDALDVILDRGDPLQASDLVLSGGQLIQVLGKKPGPWVGVLQQELLAWVIEDPSRNESEQLIAHARAMLASVIESERSGLSSSRKGHVDLGVRAGTKQEVVDASGG